MVLIIGLFVLLLIIIALIGYFVGIYNGLIRLSKNMDKAWSNIGVLLKQRHDEIPKLIKVCEGYMKYEKETLKQITEARVACMRAKTVEASSEAEGRLSGLLRGLFAVAENYPNLKSNEHFTKLQERISYLESQIADRREFYNDSVNTYNIRIAQIPDVFVARMIHMQPRQLFEVSEADKKDVDIKFNFPK
jgi:LemA protein